jgi:peptidoglycan/xylan/chitin deacetylase (PgdA/CDA1 family)
MHETPQSQEPRLRRQFEWAAKYFTIGSLEDFADWWKPDAQPSPHAKPLVLFTFDDGRESNYHVAAPLLEEFGGRGVFFVVPAFAQTAGTERALAFYRTRINPEFRSENEADEDWKPMSPRHVEALANRGHAIGNHTFTHERMVKLSALDLDREIGDSARTLASWTGKPVDAFAWTFGWDAIDIPAWQAIQRHHRFCFSPCPGIIDLHRDHPSLLWRREIETRYSAAELRFSYSGLADLWWARRRRRLRSLLAPAPAPAPLQ